MKTLTLNLAANTIGQDPEALLYAAIKAADPDSPFTADNSTLAKIKPWPGKYLPSRTYLKVVSNDDPKVFAQYYYNRFDITLYVANPLFTAAEGAELEPQTGVQVLAAIAAKVNLNLTERDFWVEAYQFTSTGGTSHPNFRLKARLDSPFWYNELIVHLYGKTATVN